MITFIRGNVIEILPSFLVLECNGVGYEVVISLNTYSKVKNKEKNLLIYTHHHIREDAEILYGFADKKERLLFRNLISVNGIGPSSAISMLSSSNSTDLAKAIREGDVDVLKTTKGIGVKTAQRIIIELKDKIGEEETEGLGEFITNNDMKNEAISALEVLGIGRKLSEPLINKFLKNNPNSTVEDLIKLTLKNK